jgi:hypothetical protein
MAGLIERVTDYRVALVRNDLFNFRQFINLTTESGVLVDIGFSDDPPDDWIDSDDAGTHVRLHTDQFDRIWRLLQDEAPVYFTAFSLFGRNFVLTTDPEPPGEGPVDADHAGTAG